MGEREAFEAWHKTLWPYSNFERHTPFGEDSGRYKDFHVQLRFDGWQARAKLPVTLPAGQPARG